MEYDAAGELTGQVDPLGRRVTFAYDRVGNRVTRTNARGQTVTSTFDGTRQLTEELYPDGRAHQYTFDPVGNRTVMSDATGVYTATYSARNEVLSVINADNKTVQYTLDPLRRRSTLTDADGGRFTYTHDAQGRLTNLVNPRGEQTVLAHDALDRVKQKQLADGGVSNQTYDPAGRLTGLENLGAGGVIVNRFTYTYDPVANRLGVVEASGVRATWTYDATYQLTRERRSGTTAFDVVYTYDPLGNRLTQDDSGALTTYVYDAANQLSSATSASGITTYTHDADGNRTKIDAPSGITFYTWDEDNRLTVAEPPSGVITFTYNADGRRVRKETPTETTKFIFDFKEVLQATDDAGATGELYTSTTDEYGELVSEYDGAASSFHQYDALGSTDALLDPSGAATDAYVYRAFGSIAAHSGTSDSPFTFVGGQSYYAEPDLDLYQLDARYYDPDTGRFVSTDPIGFAAGDVNLYRYVGNNPGNGTDPSGLRVPPRPEAVVVPVEPSPATRAHPPTALPPTEDDLRAMFESWYVLVAWGDEPERMRFLDLPRQWQLYYLNAFSARKEFELRRAAKGSVLARLLQRSIDDYAKLRELIERELGIQHELAAKSNQFVDQLLAVFDARSKKFQDACGTNSLEALETYFSDALKEVFVGKWAGGESNLLGQVGSVALSLTGADVATDLANLTYDFTHFEWKEPLAYTGVALGVLALLPLVGAAKHFRRSRDACRVGKECGIVPNGGLGRLFGHNEYKVVDRDLAGKVKQGLLDYYFKHADNPAIDYVDNLIVEGKKRTAVIDTVTGRIKLDSSLLDPKWKHLHDGYLMEELQHFHQLHIRGWLGRTLSEAEHDLIEREVVRRLLKSGLDIFFPR